MKETSEACSKHASPVLAEDAHVPKRVGSRARARAAHAA